MSLFALPLALLIQTNAELSATVKDIYAVISGPAGKARDWDKFRGLFADGAQMRVIGKQKDGPTRAFMFTPEDYVKRSGPMLEKEGFFEREISNKTWIYGDLAQVWSTYESRHLADDAKPFARGINTMTFAKLDGKWKIVSISWTDENSAGPIPKDYLGGGTIVG